MNQYVNHTKSDDVNSDIRAISALQEQVDYLNTRIEDQEKALDILKIQIHYLKTGQ